MKRLFAGLVFILSALDVSHAAPSVRGVGLLSADFGGENLVTVQYTDGSTQDVEAGRGLALGAGLVLGVWQYDERAVEVQTTASYKFATIKETQNADVSWTRFPLEALVFYRHAPLNLRVGGGISYHLNPELKGEGLAAPIQAKFDNALGTVIQAEYLFSPGTFGVGARYTSIKYKLKDGGPSVSGDSFGFTLSIYGSAGSPQQAAAAPAAR